jgi:seryl-tRNA synthetase
LHSKFYHMLQLSYIREHKDHVIERLSLRNIDAAASIAQITEADELQRSLQNELYSCNNKANVLAKNIGELFKSGKASEANALKTESLQIKEQVKAIEEKLTQTDAQINEILLRLPNLPHESVPAGKLPEDNVTLLQEGNIPELHQEAKPHWELITQYDIIDFELGTKITGAGFPVYKGRGARLQRALINFFLDQATKAGYKEIQPPIMVNEASGFGTGQLPDKEGQMYHAGLDNLYMIPTAEVPLTNLYRDVILKAETFPVKMTAYTPCFRREAGSYGKDVRGLNRLHQFDKVEIVQLQHPDLSYQSLEEMKDYVASLLRLLELPFRILKLCGGDMGFTSALTYDFEVYSAAQEKWLEVSSVSNFETFQANRLKLRFKEGDKKPQLAHTLNGSALALPRIVAALLENNQTPEGIKIPKALQAFTGFELID